MNCRLCGKNKFKLYYKQGNNGEYKFYKCQNCGLVNYDMSTGMDQGKYGDTFIDPFNDKLKMNITQSLTYKFIKKYIKEPRKIIDIGCGNARLLNMLKAEGWQVKGLELSELLAKSVEEKLGIKVEVSDFLKYDCKPEDQSNVVVLKHVLEHLPDPILAMSKINSMLSINGYAVLEFPNIEALDLKFKRLMQKLGLHKKKYRQNYKPGHVNEFSKKSFSYLANLTGFKIEIWETYSPKPLSNFIYNKLKIGNKARVIAKKIKNI